MSEQSETIEQLALALSKAQGMMESAHKSADNPFFKSKYADLSSVWDACRYALSKNELCVIQTTKETENDQVSIVTILAHSSGQWIKGILNMTPTKTDPQGIGSCITYARRYALMAMVGIAPEDDDAEKATDHNKTPQPQTGKNPMTAAQTKLWAKLVEVYKDPKIIKAELVKRTSFIGKDGKPVKGKDSIYAVSDKQADLVRHQIENEQQKVPEVEEKDRDKCMSCKEMDVCERDPAPDCGFYEPLDDTLMPEVEYYGDNQ